MRQAAKHQEASGSGRGSRSTGISVLIAAAHAVVRSGLRRILEQAEGISTILESADAAQAAARVAEARPSVVVVDIGLPPAGGLEAIRQLSESGCSSGVMVFAPSADSDLVVRALDAGAIGFLTEDCEGGEIAEAVRRVAGGKPFLEPELMQEVALRRISARRDPLISLSPREYEIFRMLASGKSVAKVARVLALSPRSVANYQTQIKRKLGVGSTAELVHLAIRRGVIQVEQP
jgi:DNA-binding NarL/FixJ family response regulator